MYLEVPHIFHRPIEPNEWLRFGTGAGTLVPAGQEQCSRIKPSWHQVIYNVGMALFQIVLRKQGKHRRIRHLINEAGKWC